MCRLVTDCYADAHLQVKIWEGEGLGGLMCLDVSAYRARGGSSRRAKGAPDRPEGRASLCIASSSTCEGVGRYGGSNRGLNRARKALDRGLECTSTTRSLAARLGSR